MINFKKFGLCIIVPHYLQSFLVHLQTKENNCLLIKNIIPSTNKSHIRILGLELDANSSEKNYLVPIANKNILCPMPLFCAGRYSFSIGDFLIELQELSK